MQPKDLFRFGSKNWFQLAALALAGLGALYFTLGPLRYAGTSVDRATTGLAWQPDEEWHQQGSLRAITGGVVRKLVASNADTIDRSALQTAGLSATPPRSAAEIAEDRKILRTSSIDLVVKNPSGSAEQIRQLAERSGGYLETSQVNGDGAATSASLTIRVPAAQFEPVRSEIRKLGLRVESERVEAQDVTKQYVDQDARLRNLRAEEAQYLGILKRASTVSDTLEVSEKLTEVRGEIEQQQAEFNALSKQIETVAITVSLRAEEETQVFGLRWRPLYQLKWAFRDGLNGLANYAAAMASVIFYLPAALLWMATILLGLAASYRILRWAKRLLFPVAQPVPTKS